MNISAFRYSRSFSACLFIFHAALGAIPGSAKETGQVAVRAESWMQYGRIFNSTDTVAGQNFNSLSLQSFGVRVYLDKSFSNRMRAVAGAGVIAGHMLPKNPSSNGGYAPFVASPYIAEANLTSTLMDEESSKLDLRVGCFPFTYNHDSKDLGHYLLRAPVYPGIVNSGPSPNLLGFRVRYSIGNFKQDLLLKSETEIAPYFDLSPAYLAAYDAPAFRIGAGVNLYRFFPIHKKVTDGKYVPKSGNLYPLANGETIAFHGTKLMAQAAFDPKVLMRSGEAMGPDDLKIYGEVALLGLDNDSLHKSVYGDFLHRMPMMAGFNFPTFGLLDNLSIETEWYGARFSDDLSGYNAGYGSKQSPLPVVIPVLDSSGQKAIGPDGKPVFENISRDNWKWSLQGAKTFQSQFQVSLKIANDHLRPGVYVGEDDARLPGVESIMVASKDWYGMMRLAYFF